MSDITTTPTTTTTTTNTNPTTGLEGQIYSMIETLNSALPDAQRVDQGQRAAATRLRKTFQTIRGSCVEGRKDALEAVKKS